MCKWDYLVTEFIDINLKGKRMRLDERKERNLEKDRERGMERKHGTKKGEFLKAKVEYTPPLSIVYKYRVLGQHHLKNRNFVYRVFVSMLPRWRPAELPHVNSKLSNLHKLIIFPACILLLRSSHSSHSVILYLERLLRLILSKH